VKLVVVTSTGAGVEQITEAYEANAAFWVKIARQRLDRYQTDLTDPALWQMIGDPTDLDILDAGSGEGYLTRELSARGARHVYAVDVCEPLTAAAQSHPDAAPDRQSYLTADVAALPLADDSVDLIVANRIPHPLSDPARRFDEYARVLRPSGRLVLLSLHPCFYTARAERTAATPMSPGEYFGARTVVQHFNVAGITSPAPSVQRFYSLSDYLTMLTAAGFVITAVQEPHPTAEQYADPWWQENFRRPLFLLIEARPRHDGPKAPLGDTRNR
jgi:ubiquinone/menaquinone biosynthesis C-methylase UbiE